MSKPVEYNGQMYYDDRLFILNLAPCTVTYELNLITYIIHHLDAPDKYLWSVTTYKNTERYTAVRVDVFENIFEAERYAMEVEPDCPLASLNGGSWRQLQRFNQEGSEENYDDYQGRDNASHDFKEYAKWRKPQDFELYDFRKTFLGSPTAENQPTDNISFSPTDKGLADFELMKRIANQ